MTDPLQGREDQLPVRHRHVVLGQDDAEEEEESLAVSGGQDGGGGEEGAATERPAGEFVGEPHLTVQELILVSRRAERGELTCQGNWCLVAGSPPTIRILSRGRMEVPQLQLGVAGAGASWVLYQTILTKGRRSFQNVKDGNIPENASVLDKLSDFINFGDAALSFGLAQCTIVNNFRAGGI